MSDGSEYSNETEPPPNKPAVTALKYFLFVVITFAFWFGVGYLGYHWLFDKTTIESSGTNNTAVVTSGTKTDEIGTVKFGSCDASTTCMNDYVCTGGLCSPNPPNVARFALVEPIFGGDCSSGEGISYKRYPSGEIKVANGCAGVFSMGDKIIQCGNKDLTAAANCNNWTPAPLTVEVVTQLSTPKCEANVNYSMSVGGTLKVWDKCSAKFRRSDGLEQTCTDPEKPCFFP